MSDKIEECKTCGALNTPGEHCVHYGTSELALPAGSDFQFEGLYALEKMVKAAVIRARPRCYGKAPRWVAVRDVIGYGSTTSAILCRHFGLDPDEEIEGYPQSEDDEQNM